MANGINILIQIIAVVIALVIAVPVACKLAVAKKVKQDAEKIGTAEEKARNIIDEALKTAETKKREALLEAKEESLKTKNELEKETYRIVENATLTEQLLQYSNRYRSFDEGVQTAFNRALEIFENDFDYQASFEEISQALDVVEPGVTNRFVTSYEKTRENIRF